MQKLILCEKPASSAFFSATAVCPGKSTIVIFTSGLYLQQEIDHFPVFPPISSIVFGFFAKTIGKASGNAISE